MIVHEWGEIAYERAIARMRRVHAKAVEEGCNHLIFCSHPSVFTVGANDKGEWGVPAIRCDRGGAITCHSPGQLVSYFCFQAKVPARFYANVLQAYDKLLKTWLPQVAYDKARPGFYIENRKLVSLGFRYSRGVSLHGVVLNVDVDLALHNRINPCGLEGVCATSLAAEGVEVSMQSLKKLLLAQLSEVFDDPVQA